MEKENPHAGVGYTPGSDPSRDTALLVAAGAPNQRAKLWFWMDGRGNYGATHDEAVLAGLNASTGGSRMSELKDLGRITELRGPDRKPKTRLTQHKKPAGVWITVPFEKWKDKRDDWPAPEKPRSDRSDKSRIRFAKKSFEEIIDRAETGSLFATSEIGELARRALDVLGILLLVLLAGPVQAEAPIDCELVLDAEADVYVISYFAHENPQEAGKRFRLISPIGHALAGTIRLKSEWNPVAVEWRTRPAASSEPFQTAKECGEIPDPNYAEPDPGAIDELECPIDITGTVEIYLVAYYLHEDPASPGLRYRYTSSPIIVNETQNPTITAEGFPVAFEVFTAAEPPAEFVLATTCGTVPDPVFPFIFDDGFETGNVNRWTANVP